MKLHLVNDERFTEPFIKFLVQQIKLQVMANCNIQKLQPFGEMLEKLEIKIEPIVIVQNGVQAIKYRKVSNLKESGFDIFIDENLVLSGTKYKLISLIKLLDKGNTELKGYPIFSNAFEKIGNELETQYNLYLMGAGMIYERFTI